MNIEEKRKNIVHRILNTKNETLLNQIEVLLNNDVLTYTTDGKPLTVKEYKDHLQEIINVSYAGEPGNTTDEARKKIIKTLDFAKS